MGVFWDGWPQMRPTIPKNTHKNNTGLAITNNLYEREENANMSVWTKRFLTLGLLLMAGLLFAACQGATPEVAPSPGPGEPEVTQPTPVVCPTAPACPTPVPGDAEVDVPFIAAWMQSGHADEQAPAFTHWNEDDPAEIPSVCARCHSTTGFQEYVGADGSSPFSIVSNHPTGQVITCTACHNQATAALNRVIFPSGVELEVTGDHDTCMTCHQGMASMVQVDANIEAAGVADDPDTPVEELGFTNIHYYAAAASRYGSWVMGGYQYPGGRYEAYFEHAIGVDTCIDCHDPHSLDLNITLCAECHTGVASVEDLRDIRMPGSPFDYDGDGDVEEGIFHEVAGLRDMLYSALQGYAREVAGTPIVYSEEAYPYFFIDSNDDGEAQPGETIFPNRYNAWTARLARAAYNFQFSLKDPGAYAHGGKYSIQLLYDSIENLNEQLGTPIDLTQATRDDPGHFAGGEPAFRYWDEQGMVPGACAECHSGFGLPQFIAHNTNIGLPPTNGLLCETCHNSMPEFSIFEVEAVVFPNGAALSFADDTASNLCLHCHQGRESTVTVNRRIQGLPADQVGENLAFINIHYFAAAATLFGNQAQGAYQYEGQEYDGPFLHVPNFQTCVQCHDPHALTVNVSACQQCHQTEILRDIRMPNDTIDYDGDGDNTEGLYYEIQGMKEVLFDAIQAYAADTLQNPIVYSTDTYPYFFNDLDGDGELDPNEANFPNRYTTWTPRLLTAAYNYQFASKDPGGYVHNSDYIMQALYDSIEAIGGPVENLTRPPVQ
jgi:hypothetical protein